VAAVEMIVAPVIVPSTRAHPATQGADLSGPVSQVARRVLPLPLLASPHPGVAGQVVGVGSVDDRGRVSECRT
jgi:hypothetical protein